ncbi:MAG: hypothetical protein DRI44_00870 [Chlamydiae bacterium]|nr:MAG: hypothetical protein DRI44_00870 [Chlamydiota bacterium]
MGKNKKRGIALVAVLAVLVVLAILASTFIVFSRIETRQSAVAAESLTLDMLLNTGLEHAEALITTASSPSLTSKNNLSLNTILQVAGTIDKKNKYSDKWFYVKDTTGKSIGRYKINIKDEAAKVNVSKAFLLHKSKCGEGWNTGEISLPAALKISSKLAKKLIDYRYGPNHVPGARGDDDENNVILTSDGIDNDADGFIDEDDEGIDDPNEYSPWYPQGDDRKFTGIGDMLSVFMMNLDKISPATKATLQAEIPKRATVYSIDKPGSKTLPNDKPADLNCFTIRECRRKIDAANNTQTFESDAAKRSQLAVNAIDYRDENHVLSTLGSTYGVEAVCFNEVVANDESCTFMIRDGNSCNGMLNTYTFVKNKITDAGDNVDEYWEKYIGATDSKRTFFGASWPYCAIPGRGWYLFDPRHAWRVSVPKGIGKFSYNTGGSRISFKLPNGPGKKGSSSSPVLENYCRGNQSKTLVIEPPKKLPGAPAGWDWTPPSLRNNGAFCSFYNPGLRNSDKSYTYLYKDLIKTLKKMHLTKNGHPKFPNNFFKGSYAMIYTWGDPEGTRGQPVGTYKVYSSSSDQNFTIDKNDVFTRKSFESQIRKIYNIPAGNPFNDKVDISVCFFGWGNCHPSAELPNVNNMYVARSRQPIGNRYFKIMINRMPKGGTFGMKEKGYLCTDLGVDGKINGKHSEDSDPVTKESFKYWWYKDGEPIRTDGNGWLSVILNSSKKANFKSGVAQELAYLRMVAPEVTEMYNASATPVSLANWRVICNTGVLATEIGRIRRTAYYDTKLRRRVIDDNPVVKPGGHFYLVNDTELFDGWYGNADKKWGSRADEQIPVFQMDKQRWGVMYKIQKTKMFYPGDTSEGAARAGLAIYLQNENFKKDLFNKETFQFINEKEKTDPKSSHNFFFPVISEFAYRNNEIFTSTGTDVDSSYNVMVLGLPQRGGIVSLTLKNEYDQVCARTVEYGSLESDEFEFSSQKADPTKPLWYKRKVTIGGTETEALNKALKARKSGSFFIKNGPYANVGEIRKITSTEQFQQLGVSGNLSKARQMLGAIADVMCSSYLRLESCGNNVKRVGWKAANGEVAANTLQSITSKNGGGDWENNQWVGQKLRFLTGPLRGESYPIFGNSKRTILLADKKSKMIPRSSPGRKPLKPNRGDLFSLGPGYNTGFCYTRQGNDVGEWTWEKIVPVKGNYNLYINGLNDSINTTEFLEENRNASIDVDVWNYKSKAYNKLCQNKKYGKSDSFKAGKITPDNVSDTGGFKLRLTSHNVVQRDSVKNTLKTVGKQSSGFAWFNYAMITPLPIIGRVNINTASQRLLAALPGVSKELAENINRGIDGNNKPTLKPYLNLSDLLKVKGITPEAFERCCNILTVDSSVFTVEVDAQTLKSSAKDQNTKMNDNIVSATRKKHYVIELEKKTDGLCSIKKLEAY